MDQHRHNFGAYGHLPPDVWRVILSKMDPASASFMLSVHPRLFGHLMHSRKLQQCPSTEDLRSEEDERRYSSIPLGMEEPLNYMFLACSHLDANERGCFGGLCNTKHNQRMGTIPQHIKVPLRKARRKYPREEQEYKTFMTALTANPCCLSCILQQSNISAHIAHEIFSEILSQQAGSLALCRFLECFMHSAMCSDEENLNLSTIEKYFALILSFYSGGFIAKFVGKLREQKEEEGVHVSAKELFLNGMRMLKESLVFLPPIARFYVHRVKMVYREHILLHSTATPSYLLDNTKYPFGRRNWNQARPRQHQFVSDSEVDIALVRAIFEAASTIYCISLPHSRTYLSSLREPTEESTLELAREIVQAICDRPPPIWTANGLIHDVRFNLTTSATRTDAHPRDEPTYTESIYELLLIIHKILRRMFYSALTLLSEQELHALSHENLYMVTDLFSIKIFARASLDGAYQYIRTLRNVHADLHKHGDTYLCNNALGTCARIFDDVSTIQIDSFEHKDLQYTTLSPRRDYKSVQPVCVDERNRLWCVQKTTTGDSTKKKKKKKKSNGISVHQLSLVTRNDTFAIKEDLVGSFSTGSLRILWFRLRITGGLIVVCVDDKNQIIVRRYLS